MNKCDISRLVGQPEQPSEISGYYMTCPVNKSIPKLAH